MRVGIYGGTFSPPHNGHINAARAFVREAGLDKLYIIPTYLPPHKEYKEEATADERLSMCRLAFSDIPNTLVSDMEIKRGGKSYTYMTLEELKEENTELYLLCGTDMILTFDAWRNFERIFSLATVCYIHREADAEREKEVEKKVSEYRNSYGAKIIRINDDVLDISSTEIRNLISEGKTAAEYLSPKVLNFIEERGLYR